MKIKNLGRSTKGFSGTEAFWFGTVLSAIFLLVMFGLIQNFKVKIEGNAYDEVCRQYLKVHMLGKQAYIDPKLDDIPCKTQSQTIKSSKKIDIMKDVSKDMVECYNTFNRGEGNLFSANASNTWNTFCAACYLVDFQTKNIKIDNEELLAFHTSKYNYKETYADIFTNDNFDSTNPKEKENYLNKLKQYQKFAIDTNKKYMVLFKYQKLEANSVNNNIPDYFAKVVGGGVVGTVAGVILIGGAIAAEVITLGTATVVIVPVLAATAGTGMYLGYQNIHSVDLFADGKTYYSASGIYLEEFSDDNLAQHKCDFIVGIQEPGVNHK